MLYYIHAFVIMHHLLLEVGVYPFMRKTHYYIHIDLRSLSTELGSG